MKNEAAEITDFLDMIDSTDYALGIVDGIWQLVPIAEVEDAREGEVVWN